MTGCKLAWMIAGIVHCNLHNHPINHPGALGAGRRAQGAGQAPAACLQRGAAGAPAPGSFSLRHLPRV